MHTTVLAFPIQWEHFSTYRLFHQLSESSRELQKINSEGDFLLICLFLCPWGSGPCVHWTFMLHGPLGRAVHGQSPCLSHSLLGHQVLEDCYFGSERRHKSGYYFSLLLNLEKKALISFAVGSGGGVVRGDKPNLKINWIFFLIHR